MHASCRTPVSSAGEFLNVPCLEVKSPWLQSQRVSGVMAFRQRSRTVPVFPVASFVQMQFLASVNILGR